MGKRRAELAALYHRTEKGRRLDFQRFHYLAKVYADPSIDITLVCGVQTGKTEWAVADALALISLGADYQLVQPKDDLRVLFHRTRLGGPIEHSDFYRNHVKSLGSLYTWYDGDQKKGTLRVVFSTREDEMISFPADAVGVDELDRCNMANLALLPDRMLGSEFKLQRRLSTPTTVGNEIVNNVWWHYQHTDRQQYFIECPNCHTYDALDWLKHFVLEKRDPKSGKLISFELRDSEWTPETKRDLQPICTSCGLPLNRLSPGEWHPTKRMPAHLWKRGFHLNKFTSPIVEMRLVYDDYVSSRNNPVKMQRFANSHCGLPYAGAGSQITIELLQACRGNFYLDASRDRCPRQCSMGVDVHPKHLDIRISSYPFADKSHRKMEYVGRCDDFNELHKLIERFNVQMCVIDAEPETRKALEFQKEAICPVIVCYVRELRSQSVEDLDLKKIRKDKTMTIDRTVFMDCVLASYMNGMNDIPQNFNFLCDGEWVAEITNPTRVLQADEDELGNAKNERYVWTSGADHAFLADVFDYCAMLIGSFGNWCGIIGANSGPIITGVRRFEDSDFEMS